MKNRVSMLLVLAATSFPAFAQDSKPATPDAPKAVQPVDVKEPAKAEKKEKSALVVGDAAPAIKVEKFIKGEPVTEFQKGRVYVVEFWATWCGPCKAAFPHMSEMQKANKDKVTFIGVNVWEQYDEQNAETIAKFVEEQGDKMAYTVAYDGTSKHMDTNYMKASGQNGIPASFIVNQEGVIAWIGHPMTMEETLKQVIAGTYDLKAAAEKANAEKAAAEKTKPLMTKLRKQQTAQDWDGAIGTLDEILALDKAKFGNMLMAKYNILLLRKNDHAKAYALKDAILAHPELSKNPQALNQIAWGIVDPKGEMEKKDRNVDFALAIAEKAVEASKNEDGMIIDTLARCMWEKGDKTKAIETQEKAVKALEAQVKKLKDAKNDESATQMEEVLGELKATLDEYKKESAKSVG